MGTFYITKYNFDGYYFSSEHFLTFVVWFTEESCELSLIKQVLQKEAKKNDSVL